MNNKVVNKQISIQKIIDVANYLEDYKERYDKIFQDEEEKNKNLQYSEKNYQYENGKAAVKYTIAFHNGKTMTEYDYNWFVSNLNEPRSIKDIQLDLYVTFMTKGEKDDYNNQYNKISANIDFRDAVMELRYSDVIVSVETTLQEREADNVYSTIMNMLEDSEVRFNKTIKHRKIRIQCFCISIGIILSYILYMILKININKLPADLSPYLKNKNVLVLGQWVVSILLGNLLGYWYILSVYKPLLPIAKYAGYNASNNKSIYKDDLDDYLEHSEVHFGKFWDAEKRRNKIEKLYKITSKIVLAQLAISILLFFILK